MARHVKSFVAGSVILGLLFVGRPEAQDAPSIPHVVCSAFSAAMASVMASRRMLEPSMKMGEWSELHAATAIELDKAEGLPAWGTRDLITQLTSRFRDQAKTVEGAKMLMDKHAPPCVELVNQMTKKGR